MCDCKWDAVLHLVAEGHRYDEVMDDDGRPFETTAPVNAVSYRWMNGAWGRSDSTVPGTPTTAIAPIDNACDLLTTTQASPVVGSPVTRSAPAPAVPTNGVTATAVLVSTCSWTSTVKVTPTGSGRHRGPVGDMPAGRLGLRWRRQGGVRGAAGHVRDPATTKTITVAGTDAAAELPGVILMLKGRLLLDVQTSPTPPEQTTLLSAATAAIGRLHP